MSYTEGTDRRPLLGDFETNSQSINSNLNLSGHEKTTSVSEPATLEEFNIRLSELLTQRRTLLTTSDNCNPLTQVVGAISCVVAVNKINNEIQELLKQKNDLTSDDNNQDILKEMTKNILFNGTRFDIPLFFKKFPQTFPLAFEHLNKMNLSVHFYVALNEGYTSFVNFYSKTENKISYDEVDTLLSHLNNMSSYLYEDLEDLDHCYEILLKTDGFLDKIIENPDRFLKIAKNLKNTDSTRKTITDTMQRYLKYLDTKVDNQKDKEAAIKLIHDLFFQYGADNEILLPDNLADDITDPKFKADINLAISQTKVHVARSKSPTTTNTFTEKVFYLFSGAFLVDLIIMPVLRPVLANRALKDLKNTLYNTVKNKTEFSNEELRAYAHLKQARVTFNDWDKEVIHKLDQALIGSKDDLAGQIKTLRHFVEDKIIKNRLRLILPILGALIASCITTRLRE